MKKLMGIYWPGVHSVHGRDPPNALVDVWRAGEESRRALGEKEARRVRKEVREAEQSQAFERQAEDKRKAAEVETARREEADRKEVRGIECRMRIASPLQSTRRNSNGCPSGGWRLTTDAANGAGGGSAGAHQEGGGVPGGAAQACGGQRHQTQGEGGA